MLCRFVMTGLGIRKSISILSSALVAEFCAAFAATAVQATTILYAFAAVDTVRAVIHAAVGAHFARVAPFVGACVAMAAAAGARGVLFITAAAVGAVETVIHCAVGAHAAFIADAACAVFAEIARTSLFCFIV